MANANLNIVLSANQGNLNAVMGNAIRAMQQFHQATNNAGRANISLKDSVNKSTKGLEGLRKQLVSITRLFTQFFVVRSTIGYFVGLGKAAIDAADDLEKLNKQTGIGVEQLQKYGFAMEMANVNIGDFASALKNLGNKAEQALEGNLEAVKSFDDMGITLQDLQNIGGDMNELWRRTVEGLSKVNDIQKRTKTGTEVLGKQYLEFSALIADGTEKLDEYGKMAEKSGVVLSAQQVTALNALGNQVDLLNAQWAHFKSLLVLTMKDGLVPTIEGVSTLVSVFFNLGMGIKMVGYALIDFWGPIIAGVIKQIKNLIELGKTFGDFWSIFTKPGALDLDALAKVGDKQAQILSQMGTDFSITGDTIVANWKETYKKITTEADEGNKVITDKTKDLVEQVRKIEKDTFDRQPTGTNPTPKSPFGIEILSDEQLQKLAILKERLGENERALNRVKKAMDNTFDRGFSKAIQDYVDGISTLREKFVSMFKSIEDAMTDMTSKLIEGTERWQDVVKDFLRDIKKSFIKMISEILVQGMMKQFLGAIGGIFGGGAINVGNLASGNGSSPAPGGNAAGQAAAIAASTGMSMTGVMANFSGGAAGAAAGGGFNLMGMLPFLGVTAGMGLLNQGQQTGNTFQSGLGGGFAGAGLGAMIGGPIGAIIGGGLGIFGGSFLGSKAKQDAEKEKQEQEDALEQQEEELRKQREEARGLIIKSVRSQFGGGNAIEQVGDTVGQLFSGGISDQEIEQFGGAQAVLAQRGAIEQLAGNQGIMVQVGAPQITVGSVSSAYDVSQMARDLGILIGNGIQSGLEGMG